jgi:hypothetical protein
VTLTTLNSFVTPLLPRCAYFPNGAKRPGEVLNPQTKEFERPLSDDEIREKEEMAEHRAAEASRRREEEETRRRGDLAYEKLQQKAVVINNNREKLKEIEREKPEEVAAIGERLALIAENEGKSLTEDERNELIIEHRFELLKKHGTFRNRPLKDEIRKLETAWRRSDKDLERWEREEIKKEMKKERQKKTESFQVESLEIDPGPRTRMTHSPKGWPKTSREVIETLAKDPQTHPAAVKILNSLMNYRQANSMITYFINPLKHLVQNSTVPSSSSGAGELSPPSTAGEGRVHPSLVLDTATGRLVRNYEK